MRTPVAALPAVALVLLLSACSTAQVRLPAGFSDQAEAYEVSGHSPRRFGEPVRFGPYSALEMREGSTFSWTVPALVADLTRTSRPYAYTLVAREQPPVQVQCHARAWTAGSGDESRRLEVDLTAMAGPLLACGLSLDGQEAQPLQIVREAGRYDGRLAAPWGRQYAVRAIHAYDSTPVASGIPTGYAIVDGDSTLAVVDVVNRGRVHLVRGLDEDQRVYFAAAAAALLLLDPELGG